MFQGITKRIVTTVAGLVNGLGLILGIVADWPESWANFKAVWVIVIVASVATLLSCVWWPGKWLFRRRRFFTGKTFRLSEMDTKILGKRFEGCTFLGPGVIAFRGRYVLDGSVWESERQSAMPILYETDGNLRAGTILFQDCELVGCRFRDVGVAGPDKKKTLIGVTTQGKPSSN